MGDSGTGMDRGNDVFVTSFWRAALALLAFALGGLGFKNNSCCRTVDKR